MAAMQYHATREAQAERSFECGWCGASGIVLFHAVGKSGWHREPLLGRDDARISALAEATVQLSIDTERALGLVKCPTCGKRAPHAVRWAGIRVGFWAVLAAGLGVLSGGHDGNAFWGALLCGGVAIYFATRELSRWRRAAQAVFAEVTPGTAPPPPARRLPAARAMTAPPARRAPPPPAAKPAPAAAPASAPRAEPPPSPDGGPRFLRD